MNSCLRYMLSIMLVGPVLAICSTLAAADNEQPGRGGGTPLLKKGGLGAGERWEEGDVKDYLGLPYAPKGVDGGSISADDIASALETKQTLGKYPITKNQKSSLEVIKNEGAVSFVLREDNQAGLHVTVYESKSWNRVCNELFKYITNTVELWNEIPKYYKVVKGGDVYLVTRDEGNLQKWHFALEKQFIIVVYLHDPQRDAVKEENAAANMDQVIKDLHALIDDVK